MSLFQFSIEEVLVFFAVLIRYSILFAVLPFIGDKVVPAPVKVLLALSVTILLFPVLVRTGQVSVEDAKVWGNSLGGMFRVFGTEALFGLVMGYVGRLGFDILNFSANLAGQFMGISAASSYDPTMESQSQVFAQIQVAIAMLLFLALEGHHLMLRAVIDSYGTVGLGKAELNDNLMQGLIRMTSDVIRLGFQIAGPITVSMFVVNVAFGVMAKAMPQMNILALSFGVTIFVGLFVTWIGMGEFGESTREVFALGIEWLQGAKRMLGSG